MDFIQINPQANATARLAVGGERFGKTSIITTPRPRENVNLDTRPDRILVSVVGAPVLVTA